MPERTDPAQSTREIEVRAADAYVGDYLLGLGRIVGKTSYARKVTLHGEGGDWKVAVDGRHPVVVLRAAVEP